MGQLRMSPSTENISDYSVSIASGFMATRKEGGTSRVKGMGTALLRAAEEDVERLGASGLVVWGVSIPVFMRASWFRKRGYTHADNDGMMKFTMEEILLKMLLRQSGTSKGRHRHVEPWGKKSGGNVFEKWVVTRGRTWCVNARNEPPRSSRTRWCWQR